MAILFSSLEEKPDHWRVEFEKLLPDMAFRVWPDEGGDPADILYALVWRHQPGGLGRYRNLKAVINLGAGVDHVLTDPSLPPDVPLIRLVDRSLTEGMSDFVLHRVLHFFKDMHRYEALQRQGRWRPLPPPDKGKCTVGILGLGVLGGDAAQKLAGLGFPVAGWSRTAKRTEGVECFHGADGLDPFLRRTRILVCLLPLTPDTEGILDTKMFAALPAGAFVVNSARGGHLAEDDLIEALDSGHLAGAALDVFREEPLPEGHPFWTHPKIIITPHMASWTIVASAAATVAENIRRMEAGRPPFDVVDREKGY
jgi:glyoxylate/hydroxypyruvate reductase A